MFEGIFQPMHLLVILFIALMVFGPKKLPELGKGLGDGIRSFKDSMRNEKEDEPRNPASPADAHVISIKEKRRHLASAFMARRQTGISPADATHLQSLPPA